MQLEELLDYGTCPLRLTLPKQPAVPAKRTALFQELLSWYFFQCSVGEYPSVASTHRMFNTLWCKHMAGVPHTPDQLLEILEQVKNIPLLMVPEDQVAALHYPFVLHRFGRRIESRPPVLVMRYGLHPNVLLWTDAPRRAYDYDLMASYYNVCLERDLGYRKPTVLNVYHIPDGRMWHYFSQEGKDERDTNLLFKLHKAADGKLFYPNPSEPACRSCSVSQACPSKIK